MALDGRYNVTIEAMGKKTKGVVEIHTSGTTVRGTVTAAGQTIDLQDGKASGDSFTGKVSGNTPMGNLTATVKGQVSGNAISGKLRAGLIGASFTGTRA